MSSTLAFGGLPRLFFGGEGFGSTVGALGYVTEKGEAKLGEPCTVGTEKLDWSRLSLTGDTSLTACREGVAESSPVSHVPELVRLTDLFADV